MIESIKRLRIYFKEMYPILPRLVLGYIVAMEIYFMVLLNHGVFLKIDKFERLGEQLQIWIWIDDKAGIDYGSCLGYIGIQELLLGFTVFAFLCWLRIADDLKDYELDCRLFPERALPSGRVHKKDLVVLAVILGIVTVLLNIALMPNWIFCIILYTYGSLMAVWFFQKHKISKCLPLALLTHNPVQLVLNIYIISFVIMKFKYIPIFDTYNMLAVFTLYFPALIWEVTRKIRAPKDETEYVTYSKLFGYKKATVFALIVTWIDIITNFILVWQLNIVSVLLLFIDVSWMTYIFIDFIKDPTRYKLVDKVEKYTYIQETLMLLTVVWYIHEHLGM